MARYPKRQTVTLYRRSFYTREMRLKKGIGIAVLVVAVLAAAWVAAPHVLDWATHTWYTVVRDRDLSASSAVSESVSSGTQSTYRGLGSIDIMAAVRSLIFIGKVRKDPTTRVLIHEKSSLAPPGETMAFKLGDEEGFRWVGAYEISTDELLDGKEGKATETKLERGVKLIRELLVDKKEISSRDLDEKAKEQGISGRTMRDVRSRMKNELEYRVNEKQENSIRLKE